MPTLNQDLNNSRIEIFSTLSQNLRKSLPSHLIKLFTQKGIKVYKGQKNQWQLDILNNIEVIIIADTFFCLARDLPPLWKIHIFPKVLYANLTTIFQALVPSG